MAERFSVKEDVEGPSPSSGAKDLQRIRLQESNQFCEQNCRILPEEHFLRIPNPSLN